MMVLWVKQVQCQRDEESIEAHEKAREVSINHVMRRLASHITETVNISKSSKPNSYNYMGVRSTCTMRHWHNCYLGLI